jgi:hypothetical protein
MTLQDKYESTDFTTMRCSYDGNTKLKKLERHDATEGSGKWAASDWVICGQLQGRRRSRASLDGSCLLRIAVILDFALTFFHLAPEHTNFRTIRDRDIKFLSKIRAPNVTRPCIT